MAEKETENDDERTMEVLVMGLGRCGTTSLAAALKILGYRPYDYIDRFNLEHTTLWTNQLRVKYSGQGKKWEKADFDKVTQGFDVSEDKNNFYNGEKDSWSFPESPNFSITYHAILDRPCNFFTEELLAAYPSARVILNTRPFEPWHKSMLSTVWKVQAWPSQRLLQYTEPRFAGAKYAGGRLYWGIFCGNDPSNVERCRKAFDDHNDHIRAVVPKDRLLEYPIGAGWDPLCDFLGKSVPKETAFPHINDKEKYLE
ncbi:MAG: hypothetical protein L6R42_004340, partial [Xanthoria sp. 1 TBL-2021]